MLIYYRLIWCETEWDETRITVIGNDGEAGGLLPFFRFVLFHSAL